MGGIDALAQGKRKEFEDLLSRENGTHPTGLTLKTDLQKEKLAAYKIESQASPSLGTGAKTYLYDWMLEQLFERKKEFSSKQTEKGNFAEPECLELCQRFLDDPYLSLNVGENKRTLRDEFMRGTCDSLGVLRDDLVVDLKSPISCFTMPKASDNIDSDYYAQGQVYMHLAGRKRYLLFYGLCDASPEQMEKAAYWRSRQQGYEDIQEHIHKEVIAEMTYSNLPDWMRIEAFFFDYDPTYIEKLKTCVLLAREYLAEQLDLFMQKKVKYEK